ncbi:MAG: peptidyl-dipeptidase A [Alphaproteobacteria bacterium]|nr:MAG: peptidyl-dipeptidase A [Caulobacteraceae bacterium]TPW03494.1 MAG: peptidyl-dipeptidase A [Alphaproteobacteria bacterium]
MLSMKKARWLAAAAIVALAAACAHEATAPSASVTPVPVVAAPPAPRLSAAEFVARAEAELAAMSEAAGRADWMRQTNITFDTNWLAARANAQITERASALAKEAASYPAAGLDPVVARKLELMKRGLTLPAPGREGVAQQMADIATKLEEIYATGTFRIDGRDIDLEAASNEMVTSRDPRRLAALWTGWHSISPPMRDDYARLVSLANEGSAELGFTDTGALWRSKYDMPADAFAAETDRLWGQVEPLYKQLHCYTRARLNARYGEAVQPASGPIRADLLGNMWAQSWGNIYDVVAPRTRAPSIDVTARLRANRYDAVKMVRTGEGFFSSLGFAPLPETFWQRSMITRPQGRDVVCHASAWDLDNMDDIRIKMCTEVNEEDFQTVHHELGHNYYQRAYKNQPYMFKDGANDGFHEAIGDMVGLSITPEYLRRIGLINQVPGDAADTGLLLRMALDKVAFMPFGLLVDKWRWQVYSGQATPATYNEAWWKLRTQYQGIVAPGGPRPADAFDPGAKYHVPANVPYMRYFLSHILQFQFYRAACQQAGWTGPLHRCTIYGNKEVGARFNAMMEMGQSKPWPDALEAFTGQREIDASAVTDYFKPLQGWLEEQNRGQQCGW